MFVPVASALTGAHRNRQILASNPQQPEIQPLKLRGQIVSADPPLLTDGHTTIILIYDTIQMSNFMEYLSVAIPWKPPDMP